MLRTCLGSIMFQTFQLMEDRMSNHLRPRRSKAVSDLSILAALNGSSALHLPDKGVRPDF
jgi:hypothetical protein